MLPAFVTSGWYGGGAELASRGAEGWGNHLLGMRSKSAFGGLTQFSFRNDLIYNRPEANLNPNQPAATPQPTLNLPEATLNQT